MPIRLEYRAFLAKSGVAFDERYASEAIGGMRRRPPLPLGE